MKIGLWSNHSNLFNYKKNRDGYTYRWFDLEKKFKSMDIFLSTFNSCNEVENFDIIIENGIRDCKHDKRYLIINESPLIRPQDWDQNKHKEYKKVFTWDDELIDEIKYFKINYAFDIPKNIPKKFEDKKLCCVIAGNKNVEHPQELYSKRVEFIKWFEKNHLDEFDLYGVGWKEKNFGKNFFARVLNKVKPISKLFASKFSSYKGEVKSKNEVIKKYKFSICYENVKDQSGYITEKIFDIFFAGCIPLYWGAKNVTDYIPKDCFIDKREFSSHQEIYEYMKNMNERTYMDYLNNIEDFLNSKKADPFRSNTFAKTIVNEIVKDLHDNS
jgi:hypothetical protein